MKWEGQIAPPGTGDYKLNIEGPAGDSCSLWIDGKQVLPTKPVGGADPPSATVTTRAGKLVTYRLDYTHATGAGALKLMWEGPSVDRQEIPDSAYVDAWGRFLNNEGHPPDLYLKLAGEAKAMLAGQRSPSDLLIK